MPTSDARLAANRRNASKSTGPRTAEGKERSRANSYKHGMTGAGVVVSGEDAAETGQLARELEAELRPSGRLARVLVGRVAALSVRMDRSVRREEAALARRVRHAATIFDDARSREVEHMFAWIAHEPATFARRLRLSPEGVDCLIRAWIGLEADLTDPGLPRWEHLQRQRAENLTGRKPDEVAPSRLERLGMARLGHRDYLHPGEGDGLDADKLRDWIDGEILATIRAEVAALRALLASFDPATTALDRAEAGERALFDPSKEATLARKYEAAAERGFYRALREFREVQAEAAEHPEAVDAPAGPPTAPESDEPLASFFPGHSDAVPPPTADDFLAEKPPEYAWARAIREDNSGPMTLALAGPGPG